MGGGWSDHCCHRQVREPTRRPRKVQGTDFSLRLGSESPLVPSTFHSGAICASLINLTSAPEHIRGTELVPETVHRAILYRVLPW